MKTSLVIFGLLAIPAFAMAEGTTDGVLGTNNVYGYGIYENCRFSDKTNLNYKGMGLGINQNVFSGEKFGVDAGFNYEYWNDTSSNAANYYACNAYMLSATTYMKGTLSPFVTTALYYDSSSYDGASNSNSTWFLARLGVEMHLKAGWYVSPSIALWQRIHSDDPAASACADFTAETGYWFANRVCLFANANYREMNATESLWANVGLRVRY